MNANASVQFFEAQFQRQIREDDLRLNPFEELALPYLRGRVLDYGCGLGNLAVAAAQQGCSVLALDASPTAIDHLRRVAVAQSLPIEAAQVDLRAHPLEGLFDTVVSIGLLMFFDCQTALQQLKRLQSHLRPGGVAVVNALVQGTTYLDMFDAQDYCLLALDELPRRFKGWDILHTEIQDFAAPQGRTKSFQTLIARKRR